MTRRESAALVAVGLLVALALLTGLGDVYLWEDEARVAVLGANVLRAGVPVVWDGRNLVHDPTWPHAFDDRTLVWNVHTWIPFYLAAAGIAVGGRTTWAARLPFALAAVAAVPLLFLTVRHGTGRRRLAWLTVAVLATNVPYYLYGRQANYYPLLYLAGIGLWWYLLQLGRTPRAWLGLGLSTTFLYHTNPLVFFHTYAALTATLLVCRAGWRQWRGYLQASLLTAALTLPMFLWAGLAKHGGAGALHFPGQSTYNLVFFRMLAESGLAVCPWVLMLPGVFLRRGADEVGTWWAPPLRITACLVAGFCLFYPMYNLTPFLRHYCGVFPMVYVLVAAGIDAVWRWRRWAGVSLLIVQCLSSTGFALTWIPLRAWAEVRRSARPEYATVLQKVRHGLGPLLRPTDMVRYATELRQEFVGPMEGAVAYLREHASPEDLVLVRYPHEPIAFYTDLRVCNRLAPTDPIGDRFPSYISNVLWPDWVILRVRHPDNAFYFPPPLHTLPQYYDPIELRVRETTWENLPDPQSHRYRTATDGPPLVIWKRREGTPQDPWHRARTEAQ